MRVSLVMRSVWSSATDNLPELLPLLKHLVVSHFCYKLRKDLLPGWDFWERVPRCLCTAETLFVLLNSIGQDVSMRLHPSSFVTVRSLRLWLWEGGNLNKIIIAVNPKQYHE